MTLKRNIGGKARLKTTSQHPARRGCCEKRGGIDALTLSQCQAKLKVLKI